MGGCGALPWVRSRCSSRSSRAAARPDDVGALHVVTRSWAMDPRSHCQALTESVLTIRLIVAHGNLEDIADLDRFYEQLDRSRCSRIASARAPAVPEIPRRSCASRRAGRRQASEAAATVAVMKDRMSEINAANSPGRSPASPRVSGAIRPLGCGMSWRIRALIALVRSRTSPVVHRTEAVSCVISRAVMGGTGWLAVSGRPLVTVRAVRPVPLGNACPEPCGLRTYGTI